MGRDWTSGIKMDDLSSSMDTRIGPASGDNGINKTRL